MTKPQTCSHPIYTQALPGVCQAESGCFLCVLFVSIGTLESGLLSQSTQILKYKSPHLGFNNTKYISFATGNT